jgi:hypothetical protein
MSKTRLTIALLISASAYAQTWSAVGTSSSMPTQNWSSILFYPSTNYIFVGSFLPNGRPNQEKGMWRGDRTNLTAAWTKVYGPTSDATTNQNIYRVGQMVVNASGEIVFDQNGNGCIGYVSNPTTSPSTTLTSLCTVRSLVQSVNNANILFTIAATSTRTIYKSTDGGHTWATLTTLSPSGAQTGLVSDGGSCMYSLMEADLASRSCDDGATWQGVGRCPNCVSVKALANGDVLGGDVDNYPRKWDGTITTNGTHDWIRYDTGIPSSPFGGTHYFTPNTYAQATNATVYSCGKGLDPANLTQKQGVIAMKSTNSGANWVDDSTGLTQNNNVHSGFCAIGPDGYLYLGVATNDSTNPNVIGSESGLFRALVNTVGIPPSITSSCPLPDGTVGSAYSQTVTATGDATITWDLSTGSLPTGLSILSGGAITGTPSAGGSFSFTLRATNSTGADTKSCSAVIVTTVHGGMRSGRMTVSGSVIQ